MDNHIGFIEKVVDRLDQRKRVLVAIPSLEALVQGGLVESRSEEWLCWNAPVPANVRFECNSSFTCNGMFDCSTTRAVTSYSQCGGSKDSYECNSNGFSCSLGGSDADYFSCSAFECAGAAPDTSYTCSNIDFVCGGPDYDCVVNFQCTAGHLFSCTQEHTCQDNFQCSAGTECGQPGASTNSCTPGGPVMGYNMPGGGTTPGDFLCNGWHPDGSETFDCSVGFVCNATSDFACASDGDSFTCNGSVSDFGSFSCETDFECYVSFTCEMSVSCGNTPATEAYQCQGAVVYNSPYE